MVMITLTMRMLIALITSGNGVLEALRGRDVLGVQGRVLGLVAGVIAVIIIIISSSSSSIIIILLL